MRFRELAWGAALHYYWTGGDSPYQDLVSDTNFLGRLQNGPTLADFDQVRVFLAKYRSRPRPELAKRYLDIWLRIQPSISALASETLLTCNLTDSSVREQVEFLYSHLQSPFVEGASGTIASKVLHFLNTSLFVMWDLNIQGRYLNLGARTYSDFLLQMQRHALQATEEYEQLPSEQKLGETAPENFISASLGLRHTRPMAKLVDDFNWMTITNQAPPTMPRWLWMLFDLQ